MITILNLSRRPGGINDQLCEALFVDTALRERNVSYLKTRDLNLQYCSNCRICMKSSGPSLGVCYLEDDLKPLIETIFASRYVIVASPINCYDLPSIMRVILERMSIFCHWTDEMYAPKLRQVQRNITWILVTTSAMPGIMVPFTTKARSTFKLFCKPFGNRKTHFFHVGFKGRTNDMAFKAGDRRIVEKIVRILGRPLKNSPVLPLYPAR